MENATKALLMAGGILIGVLILVLIAVLFASSKDLSNRYEITKQSEKVQQFNANFTKYLGKDLTIHDVVTISNLAKEKGISEDRTFKYKDDIRNNSDIYILSVGFNEEGYINKISFKTK